MGSGRVRVFSMNVHRDSDRAELIGQVGVGRRYQQQVYQTWPCLPEGTPIARTRLIQERMDRHGQEAVPSLAFLLILDVL